MSWLLENWFGSADSLDEVRDDVHRYAQKETYLGTSGLEKPEQSSNRVPAKELNLSLYGPWYNHLQEFETELLQFIHDELPSVVRDEIGVIPFFTNAVMEGFLVLAFVRNANAREVLINHLPVALVTEDGQFAARKSFEMLPLGPIPAHSSRLFAFLFKWEEFSVIPSQEVPLSLVVDIAKHKQSLLSQELMEQKNGLTAEEEALYSVIASKQTGAEPGEVNLQVLAITPVEEGGMKVIVLFKNGLDKRLEFTEVPIYIQDQTGAEVASVSYGVKNLWVNPQESRLWGFYVPLDSLKKDVDPADCTAYIPEARPNKTQQFTPKTGNLPIQ